MYGVSGTCIDSSEVVAAARINKIQVPVYAGQPDGIRVQVPVSEHSTVVTVESPLPQDMKQLFGEK